MKKIGKLFFSYLHNLAVVDTGYLFLFVGEALLQLVWVS